MNTTEKVARGVVELDPLNSGDFRKALGHFPSGLTVVTGYGEAGPMGFTCQAFVSLSLDPPLVAIFPSLTSTSWRAIAPQGSFGVNVLAVEQRNLSGHFGRSQPDKFAGIDWQANEDGSPFLDGTVMFLDCEIEDEYPGGDHAVVMGRVRNIRLDETKKPLVFHAGAYASVGAEPQQ